jgi:hypothetical protein
VTCGSSDSGYYSSDDEWLLFGNTDSNFEPHANCVLSSEADADEEQNNSATITGLHWVYNGSICKEPDDKMPMKKTTIKPGYEHLFKNPTDAMLAVFPVGFWEIIAMEINRYADQKISNRKDKKQLIAGYKWKPVTLNNVMTYFGILMYAMLYPVTGR